LGLPAARGLVSSTEREEAQIVEREAREVPILDAIGLH
jgi:hypothetical protein